MVVTGTLTISDAAVATGVPTLRATDTKIGMYKERITR